MSTKYAVISQPMKGIDPDKVTSLTAESVLDSTMKRDIGDGKGWKVIP